MRLAVADLEDLARGAAFLGTGGGGDPYVGRLLAAQAGGDGGLPDVIDADALAGDALVVPVAGIGAPTVMLEKLFGFAEAELALEALETRLGRRADAIVAAEIGGVNSMIPLAIAARRSLPLVDADGMGRALPELQMVTFNIFGVPCTPLTIANEHGEHVLIEARDAHRAEAIARQVVTGMGGSAAVCCYPMSGRQLQACAVRGSLTLALGVGRAIRECRATGDPAAALVPRLRVAVPHAHVIELFDGKVIDLHRETGGGFARGECRLRALSDGPRELTIAFQNEYLVARRDGCTVAIVPDLVCVVDRESGEPITSETLRYGQRVKVIGMAAQPVLRNHEALKVLGPQAFGLDEPFRPLEELAEGA